MTLPENFRLKPAVINGLKERLPNQGAATYRVLNAYPVKPNLLPCISVVQSGGGIGHQGIGRVWNAYLVTDPDTSQVYQVEGTYYRQGVEITVFTLNPGERDDLAAAVRESLWDLMRELSDTTDFQEAELTEQGDGQDFDQQAPADLFMCTFHLAGIAPLLKFYPVDQADNITLNADLTLEFTQGG